MMRWTTIVATVGVLVVNGLANALPIGGKTTGQISDGFDILFTPAGYVFSIWGLIYAALVGFSIVQAFSSLRNDPQVAALRPWYVLSAVANCAWIFAWHHQRFVLTWFIMLVLLGSLIAVYRITARLVTRDAVTRTWIRAPFSLYLGWISIATIANTTVVLWTLGAVGPLSSVAVTLGILTLAVCLCGAVSLRFRDPVYAGVFVWALIGVAYANAGERTLWLGALALASVCAGFMVSSALASRRARATAERNSCDRAHGA